MIKVFLSYATSDHFFAELAQIKLQEAGIETWRDKKDLRPGVEWRNGIDRGIAESTAVLVALSPESVASSYVTFEWSYALGAGIPVIPLKLAVCKVHPRLEVIQNLDFSIPGSLPWSSLLERISEIEPKEEDGSWSPNGIEPVTEVVKMGEEYVEVPYIGAIISYLKERGYSMMSFDRVRKVIDSNLTDDALRALVKEHDGLLKSATLAGGKEGLAVRFP